VEERFDFVVQQPMNAREVFTLLTQGTDYSILVHPAINGEISALDMKNVTLEEALYQISSLYSFTVNRSGNIYQILPSSLQTRMFSVDYLNVARTGRSTMQITASGISEADNNNNNNFNNNRNNDNFGNLNNLNNLNNNNQNQGNSGGARIVTTSESDYWESLEDIIVSIITSSPVNIPGPLNSQAGAGAE